ncbi:hypothetical protein KEJ19_03640, partial [Candidatus Bathyarchaeota archaeon]|nr:hypothetical protein [Candidatus Bathyarchaeota archaeon]
PTVHGAINSQGSIFFPSKAWWAVLAKLVLYIPVYWGFSNGGLQTVARAAKRVADQLGISLDGAYRRSDIFDISLYFQNDGGSEGEELVYSDWETNRSEETVYSLMFSLTNVLRQLARLQKPKGGLEGGRIAVSG